MFKDLNLNAINIRNVTIPEGMELARPEKIVILE